MSVEETQKEIDKLDEKISNLYGKLVDLKSRKKKLEEEIIRLTDRQRELPL